MNDKQVAELFVEQRVLQPSQAEDVLNEVELNGKSIAQAMIDGGYVDQHAFFQTIADALGTEFVDLGGLIDPDPGAERDRPAVVVGQEVGHLLGRLREGAEGVNDLGDIAGQFNGNGSDLGFLLHQGKLTIISFPGAAGGTFPTSINNQGVIVGTYHLFSEEGPQHGFMWKNGAFTNIAVPGAASTIPLKINDNGDIVGTFDDANQFEHGFAFDKGHFSTIDPGGSQGTQIFALNNFDNVLGVFATSKENVLFKGFCSAVF